MPLPFPLSARKPWVLLCLRVPGPVLACSGFVTRSVAEPERLQLGAVNANVLKRSNCSMGGESDVSIGRRQQDACDEASSTTGHNSTPRRYHTRSSVAEGSVLRSGTELSACGSVEPVEQLGRGNWVEESIVEVKALPRYRGVGRSKRSLTYDEPQELLVGGSGNHVLSVKSVTRSKRSKAALVDSRDEASVTCVSPSPLSYFGFSEQKLILDEGAGGREAVVEGNTTVIYSEASSHLQESAVTGSPSEIAVTSLFEPAAVSLAVQHLKAVDRKLGIVIDMHEGPKFQKCDNVFVALARSIVFQQLATKAASAIYSRVEALCGGSESMTPEVISKLTAMELRAVGISERKASYLHDLARHFTTGALSQSSILEMKDEELMASLTAVRGIGVWSVHMFMIFSLHRPDILPVGDLGVRKGFQKLFALKALPTPHQMEELAAQWRPYRSLGSWYMWRLNMNL